MQNPYLASKFLLLVHAGHASCYSNTPTAALLFLEGLYLHDHIMTPFFLSRSCDGSAGHAGVAPFPGDYSLPLRDQRFFKVFQVSEISWKIERLDSTFDRGNLDVNVGCIVQVN